MYRQYSTDWLIYTLICLYFRPIIIWKQAPFISPRVHVPLLIEYDTPCNLFNIADSTEPLHAFIFSPVRSSVHSLTHSLSFFLYHSFLLPPFTRRHRVKPFCRSHMNAVFGRRRIVCVLYISNLFHQIHSTINHSTNTIFHKYSSQIELFSIFWTSIWKLSSSWTIESNNCLIVYD